MATVKQSGSESSPDHKIRGVENAQENTPANDIAEETSEPEGTGYQIRPQLYEKFKPLNAKEMIHNVLFDQLSSKKYVKSEAFGWCKEISDILRKKIKEMYPRRYKFVTNIVIGEQHGAGVKVATRCIWDTESDSYAYENFMNDTLFCNAAIYAVYYY